jgi:hypothetical protein
LSAGDIATDFNALTAFGFHVHLWIHDQNSTGRILKEEGAKAVNISNLSRDAGRDTSGEVLRVQVFDLVDRSDSGVGKLRVRRTAEDE